jgi:holin-like protein
MIAAFALLFFCQLIGEILVRATGLPVPGPVIGLLLLLALISRRGGVSEDLDKISGTLLRHLSLLFVPAGTGVMVHAARLSEEALAIGVTLIGSTIATLLVTVAVFRKLAGPTEPEARP